MVVAAPVEALVGEGAAHTAAVDAVAVGAPAVVAEAVIRISLRSQPSALELWKRASAAG